MYRDACAAITQQPFAHLRSRVMTVSAGWGSSHSAFRMTLIPRWV
jgi:hypothetical protein